MLKNQQKNPQQNKYKAISAGCTACLSKNTSEKCSKTNILLQLVPLLFTAALRLSSESWCTQEAIGTNKSLLIKYQK